MPAPDRPTVEEALAMLEAMLSATGDAVLVVSAERRVVAYNAQYSDLVNVSPAMLAASTVDDALANLVAQVEDPERWRARSAQIWSDPFRDTEDVIRFRDGRLVLRRSVACRAGDRLIGRIATFRDISTVVETAEALERNQAFLEKAQEVAHLGSFVVDLAADSGRITWSAETHRIFGVPPGGFDGTPEAFYGFLPEEDREQVRRAADATLSRGEPYDLQHRIVRADGTPCWVHQRADLERDPDGRPLRMIGTIQDITSHHELEEQLRQAQKMEAIGRLAGGVAHDLNNALTAIGGYTELALSALDESHPARSDVQEIRRAAERAASVTGQLLAFSRKQVLERRVFDLNATVSNLGRMLGRLLGDDVVFETAAAPSLPPIHADPGQIEQAIINLAVNARDAMPRGGRLTLATSFDDVDQAYARAHRPLPAGRWVVLSVADSGHGMSEEVKARIFEPFFTTKEVGKGTGLGLSMVYGTVKQNGGFIYVDSVSGQGTTFRLFFPPAAQPADAAAAPPDAADAGGGPGTILVVEDEPAVRQLVATCLVRDGFNVFEAGSAAEARTVAAAHPEIQLLLSDANMPGESGLELAGGLVAARPDLLVVIMSGYTEESLDIAGLAAPAAMLHKPFTPKELQRRIRQVLDAGRDNKLHRRS